MASRSELTRLGLEELGDMPGSSEARLVKAFAAMLAAATAPKRKNTTDETKLAVAPRALFDAVRASCSDRILCEPVDGRWFGRLGGALKALPSFGAADVELLTGWLTAGGMQSWPQGVPTFGHLITHLANWTALAREWDRRGRQTLRPKGGSVGAAAVEGTDWSAFAAPRLT